MQYSVLKLKNGEWAVQNNKTMAIVNTYREEAQAIRVCSNLNKR